MNKSMLERALSGLWLLLGAGLAVDVVLAAVRYLNTKLPHTPSIWISMALAASVCVASILLGLRIFRRDAVTVWLGFGLSTVLSFYTIFILMITPTEALLRWTLLIQVYVLALSAVTIIYLVFLREAPTA